MAQALCSAALGPGVRAMGPGPDGGRDATFDGPVPLSSHGSAWSGYGVVQVKHKASTGVRRVDASWLIDEIRGELTPWRQGKRRSRKPELYLLVTNVRLTAVPGSGGLDRVDRELEEFRQALGMRGFLVWDGETIDALLDAHPQVRRTYSAWVTASDVLTAALERFGSPGEGIAEALPAAISKELLARRSARLDEAGDGGEHAVPLASVFVDMPALAHTLDQTRTVWLTSHDQVPADHDEQPQLVPDVAGTEAEVEAAAGEVALDALLSPWGTTAPLADESDLENLTLDEQLLRDLVDAQGTVETPALGILLAAGNLVLSGDSASNRHNPSQWVVVGGPGQGKSTIGQFLCQLYRAHLLAGLPIARAMPELGAAVRALMTTADAENLPPVRAQRWPLHIPLAAFGDALTDGAATSIFDFAANRLADYHRPGTVDAHDLRSWLHATPWCVVFDGLDEVSAPAIRDQVLKAITDFRVEIASAGADVLLVATTRPQGYNDEFGPGLFHHLRLQPLPAPVAERYATRLVEARYNADPAGGASLLKRVRAALAETSPATTWLMRSPLQVTIMTMLLSQIGEAPTDRAGLFSEYYDTIYRRELGKNLTTSRLLREHRHVIDALHNQIGLLLQARGAVGATTGSQIALSTVVRLLWEILADEGFTPEETTELASRLRDTTTERLVFLVGATADSVAFELRSLQEYCAARALLDGPDHLLLPRLAVIAGSSHWRNTLSLACGLVFTRRRSSRDLIITFCHDLDSTDVASSAPAAWVDPATGEILADAVQPGVLGGRTTRAGAELAATLLADGVAYSQPRYRNHLLSIAHGLFDRTDSLAVKTLLELAARADLRAGIRAAAVDVLHSAEPSRRLTALYSLFVQGSLVDDHEADVILSSHLAGTQLAVRQEYVLQALAADLRLIVRRLATDLLQIPLAELIHAVTTLDRPFTGSMQRLDDGAASLVLNTLARFGRAETLQEQLPLEPGPTTTDLDWMPADGWRHISTSSTNRLATGRGWSWLRSAIDYARKPTRHHLRAAVEAVDSADLDDTMLAWVLSCLPWPVTALHGHREDPAHHPRDLLSTSPRAIRTIEREWATGIELADLLAPHADGSFPIAASRVPGEFSEEAPRAHPIHTHEHLEAVLEAGRALRDTPCGAHVSRRALWLLQQIPPCTPPELLAGDPARRALAALRQHAIHIDRCGVGWIPALAVDPGHGIDLECLGRRTTFLTVAGTTAPCCESPVQWTVDTLAADCVRDPHRNWGVGRLAEALHDLVPGHLIEAAGTIAGPHGSTGRRLVRPRPPRGHVASRRRQARSGLVSPPPAEHHRRQDARDSRVHVGFEPAHRPHGPG